METSGKVNIKQYIHVDLSDRTVALKSKLLLIRKIMNSFFYTVLSGFILCTNLNAQNLVYNGDFEHFVKCPGTWNTVFKEEVLPGWTSANLGTPDYFNRCSTAQAGVPRNWAGRAEPYDGDAYAGIYTYLRARNDYREYLQTELTKPLEENKEYWIEFYYRLSEYSAYSTDRIGLYLSEEPLRYQHDKVISKKPTLDVVKKEALDLRTGEWELAGMRYRAHGNERYLIIGNFYPNYLTEVYKISHRERLVHENLESGAYYFIDAVKVMPMDSLMAVLERERLPQQVKPGDTYVLRNIQFAYDSYELLPASFPELEKLLNILTEQPKIKIQLAGHTDDQGTVAYNQTLSERRAQSVAAYLQQRGIAAGRISYRGYGKSRPLINERSESARAANRRVEVTFME